MNPTIKASTCRVRVDLEDVNPYEILQKMYYAGLHLKNIVQLDYSLIMGSNITITFTIELEEGWYDMKTLNDEFCRFKAFTEEILALIQSNDMS